MTTALIIGASRGIGKEIAVCLASHPTIQSICIASKTESDLIQLSKEIQAQSSCRCIYSVCDVRDANSIKQMMDYTLEMFNHIDFVIYNAGAIHWGTVMETSLKRFQLMQQVNIQGLYITVSTILPHFIQRKQGRFVIVSPPIYSRFFRGKTAYAVGKVGMSVLAMGLAMDLQDAHLHGISVTCLWPATAIQSAVTDKLNISPHLLRHPRIFADAVTSILFTRNRNDIHGKTLIDEDWLREHQGVQDFTKYSICPGQSVPRMMPVSFPSLLVKEQQDKGIQFTSKL